MQKLIHLLGYASALGGVHPGCGQGPLLLRESPLLRQVCARLSEMGVTCQWGAVVQPSSLFPEDRVHEIQRLCQGLAAETALLAGKKEFFIVTGGDHTSAIGTWSGVCDALTGPLGLIWVDAHMDSHTPETSESGRFHGMALATLLGQGEQRLTQLRSPQAKLKPEHLCLIGIRSYEDGEALLLKKLGVRIYFMDEVKRRGLADVMQEAREHANQGTVGYGLSLDVDGLDPKEAPGVDVPEPDGLSVREVSAALEKLASDPRLLGMEIVEFDPDKDQDQLTEKAIAHLIEVAASHYAKR